MGNGCEPTGTSDIAGDIKGSNGGTDSNGRDKKKVAMVRERGHKT